MVSWMNLEGNAMHPKFRPTLLGRLHLIEAATL